MEKGRVHVYTGDGKGKTTAALGLAIRAKGAGLSVCVIQFLKTAESGELKSLAALGIPVIRKETVSDFFNRLSEEQKNILKKEISCEFAISKEAVKKYDMVVLDEIFCTAENGLLQLSQIINLIKSKPKKTELILTGRHAPAAVTEIADYVSEIIPLKHPFSKGTAARRGIEF